MRRGAVIAFLMPLILAAQPARANDTEAVLAGGVLTFKKSDGIAMESEELTIAPHKVEVAYQFRNTTAADITTRVAFPMAPYTSVEDQNTWEALETETERKKYWQEFGRFTSSRRRT